MYNNFANVDFVTLNSTKLRIKCILQNVYKYTFYFLNIHKRMIALLSRKIRIMGTTYSFTIFYILLD